jgi:hypothetical protein
VRIREIHSCDLSRAARVPQSIVNRLRSGLNRALAIPAIQAKFRDSNLEPGRPMTQDELRALLKADYDTWGRWSKLSTSCLTNRDWLPLAEVVRHCIISPCQCFSHGANQTTVVVA